MQGSADGFLPVSGREMECGRVLDDGRRDALTGHYKPLELRFPGNSSEPFVAMGGDERIVVEVWVGRADAVDFLRLAG